MSILRQTKSLKLLLREFKNTNTAISVVSLVDKFQNKMDKTTVYRILERLESSGQLHSFMGKDGLKRYAKSPLNHDTINNLQIHPHFLCKICGNSSCLPIKVSIPSISKYIIESAEQLLVGKCKDCIS